MVWLDATATDEGGEMKTIQGLYRKEWQEYAGASFYDKGLLATRMIPLLLDELDKFRAELKEEKHILELTRELSDEVLDRAEFVWVDLGVWRCMWCQKSHMDEHLENCRFAWIKSAIRKGTAHREMAEHNKMLVDTIHKSQDKDHEISILKADIERLKIENREMDV